MSHYAFPQPGSMGGVPHNCGMTIREYAAIAAMQGILARGDGYPSAIAGSAVGYADALLAELAKGQK